MKWIVYWIAAFAVLCKCCCIENKPSEKKRQIYSLRTPENLQYSLVLPYSRVASFRSIAPRKIHYLSNRTPRLPPYAVPMEPIVQYSQKDPLYDQKYEREEDTFSKNDLQAQSKVLNDPDGHDLYSDNNHVAENIYGSFYGRIPTAPLYSPHQRYYEEPEPIIEIIIKESNETLPAPPQPLPQSIVKKDPVQVFYVKYAEDPHGSGKLIYEKPVPAVTPPSNLAEHHRETYVTVTPEPQYLPPPATTTLRTIIKPDSELYHSDSGVKVTFGTEENHHSSAEANHEDILEGHEETAPEPLVAFPQQAQQRDSKVTYNDQINRPVHQNIQKNQRSSQPIAQPRIQYQQPFINNDQLLPQQLPAPSFRDSYRGRQGQLGPINAGPSGPPFQSTPFRGPPSNAPQIFSKAPNGAPQSFQFRPNGPQQPNFGRRPPSFHSGPSRPFPSTPQISQIFNEPKYLQENYHTITTEQVNVPKDSTPNHPLQSFNFLPRPTSGLPQSIPGPVGPPNGFGFENSVNRPVNGITQIQQLPQTKPVHYFDQNRQPPSKQPQTNNHSQRVPESFPQIHSPQQQPQLPQFSFHPLPPSHQKPFYKPNGNQEQTSVPVFQTLPPSNNIRLHSSPPPPTQSQLASFNTSPQQDTRNSFQNDFHRQNLGSVLPQGGELVASIPKYEQHITVNSQIEESLNYQQQIQHQPVKNQQTLNSRHQNQFNQHSQSHTQLPNRVNDQEFHQQTQAPFFTNDKSNLQAQLAENVQKQQEEIQRLQAQLYQTQQQQHFTNQQQLLFHNQQQHFEDQQSQQKNKKQENRFEYSTQQPQIIERSKSQTVQKYPSSTSTPIYQTSLRTVNITPTTLKYSSSTLNKVKQEMENPEKKHKPKVELPDEVPDDLRQQLLSSGILDNADISILDYDKVGDTPLESLPPDQLANFFNAGGAQQLSGSENIPVVVNKFGDKINARNDELEDDQEPTASDNIPNYSLPLKKEKKGVEMKVVHFDPTTRTGQKIANDYMQEGATQVGIVNLNDKKYNRYLPLKVSGNQFPVPDILKGRQVTSVVVLAPVKAENLKSGKRSRLERATENKLKGITFVAGESLQRLLKNPSRENFENWLNKEKNTDTNQQSVVLLVTGNEEPTAEKEIFMYDIATNQVNKLSGDLSQAFVEAAETNSLTEDIDKIAIAGDGTPEDFSKQNIKEEEINEDDADEKDVEIVTDASDDAPSYVNFSSMKLNDSNNLKVSITSGYSKMKGG